MNLLHITLIAALPLCTGCRPHRTGLRPAGSTCKRISIDPATLQVSFHEEIPSLPQSQADYYQPFYRHDGYCSLDHFDTTTKTIPRIRYNAFDLDLQHRVISRTKYQIVLTGDFGTFYSQTSYYYAPYYKDTKTSFRVDASGNNLESEPPQTADVPVPRYATLSAVSVIRVFRTPTGHKLIAACYTSEGTLNTLSENNSIAGNCRMCAQGANEGNPEPFGLPARFPVATYSPASRNFLLPTALSSDVDCISFHYDRNRLVQQDILRAGKAAESRTLIYKVTPEDTALASVDEAQSFMIKP